MTSEPTADIRVVNLQIGTPGMTPDLVDSVARVIQIQQRLFQIHDDTVGAGVAKNLWRRFQRASQERRLVTYATELADLHSELERIAAEIHVNKHEILMFVDNDPEVAVGMYNIVAHTDKVVCYLHQVLDRMSGDDYSPDEFVADVRTYYEARQQAHEHAVKLRPVLQRLVD